MARRRGAARAASNRIRTFCYFHFRVIYFTNIFCLDTSNRKRISKETTLTKNNTKPKHNALAYVLFLLICYKSNATRKGNPPNV